MLTKTQTKIMQLFAANITKNFSLTEISSMLGLQYRAAHRATKQLVKDNYTIADNKRYTLNYKDHHQELTQIEYLRMKELFAKPKNKVLSLFIKDVMQQIEEEQFIFIIFGSTVTNPKPRDTDILLIINNPKKVESLERQLYVISNMFTQKFDIQVISNESVYEMLTKRDQINIINQILNKHIIVYGAETFYRMLAKGRPRQCLMKKN